MQRENRRLAAIVAADIAGYSRLIGQDEEGTLHALRSLRQELIDPLIGEHAGRIANTAGDSLLLEFPSAVDAVRCALAIQQGMAERNENADGDRQIRFRIGINVGDVVAEADDLLGDGVNLAARLEGLAEPGGICLSAAAHDYVVGKVDAVFADSGEHDLKNIARPIHVWRWRADVSGASPSMPGSSARVPLPTNPSIAVLAFDNMSGDPEQEYFADGVAEEIITALSKFRWFFVIDRNSSFAYKGKAVPVRRVAEELGVRYVLEGSVRKSGSRVRISAELIDATTGSHLWAERYDRELADIFDLQDDITETIVGALEPELGGAERARAERKPPDSLDAWDHYQRGLWHYWRYSKDDAEAAEQQFQSAIELDPDFGPARAGLAYILFNEVVQGWTDAPDATLRRGLQAAQQAVSLDDRDAFAHCVLGRVHTILGDPETAIRELEIALDLNPNLAAAHFGLGFALVWSGRPREALPHFYRAIRQSPHDPNRSGFELMTGYAHMLSGEYDAAVEWQRKAARHANSGFWPHLHLAVAFVELERLDEARTALDVALQARAGLSVTAVSAIIRKLHPPLKDRFLNALRKAGLPE